MPLTQVDQGLLGQYAQYTGFKNRIINGNMVIDQRNAGASVSYSTGSASYLVDRWYGQGVASAGVFTLQQSTDAPAGFSNSVKATVTTASTPSGTNVYRFIQRLEGYNLADINLGTSNAASFTLSFWVKASVTGTFGGSFWGAGATRWFIFSYTINSANTWEYKTVTVSPVTSGTFQTTNSTALQLTFNIGAGSSVLGAAGSWISNDSSTEYYGPTGQTNLIATNGATFYITGVQLEKGSTATSFDYRPYGTELALCQRYAVQFTGGGSGSLYNNFAVGQVGTATVVYLVATLPVTLRAAPTVTFNGTLTINSGGIDYPITSFGTTYGQGSGVWLTAIASGGGLTAGRGANAYTALATSNWILLSSEL